MTLNKDSIYTVRGYYEGGERTETQQRNTSAEAAFAAKEMLDAGCRCVDIDLQEKPAQRMAFGLPY